MESSLPEANRFVISLFDIKVGAYQRMNLDGQWKGYESHNETSNEVSIQQDHDGSNSSADKYNNLESVFLSISE